MTTSLWRDGAFGDEDPKRPGVGKMVALILVSSLALAGIVVIGALVAYRAVVPLSVFCPPQSWVSAVEEEVRRLVPPGSAVLKPTVEDCDARRMLTVFFSDAKSDDVVAREVFSAATAQGWETVTPWCMSKSVRMIPAFIRMAKGSIAGLHAIQADTLPCVGDRG
ncbi:MAG: hypothetical protein U0904_10120 [Candidatus Nanopelagicales bacterium]|nr:hypothetical protein [Candidatus Nanopelagicales bacterium]